MSMVEEVQTPQAPTQLPPTRLKQIPLRQIRESKVALRDVDRENDEYIGLVDSIRRRGVLLPVLVREIGKENGEVTYSLVDGLQRYTASQDAGRETIPAQIIDMNDGAVLEAQIIANVHRVEMKAYQYSKQLQKILAQNPFMAMSELADRLSKSPSWLNDRLGLTKLSEEIGQIVDEGKINLSNAYVLAKLPKEEQVSFIERAMTQPPSEFAPQVNARVKEIKEARRQGREAQGEQFVAMPFCQKVPTIKSELDNPSLILALIENEKPKTPVEAAKLTLRWVLSIDPITLAERKRIYDDKKTQEKADKEKRDREKLAKRTLDAQKTAMELQEKATASGLDLEAERKRLIEEDAAAAAAAAENGETETGAFEKE